MILKKFLLDSDKRDFLCYNSNAASVRFRKREYMLKKRIVSFALAMSCALLCGCSEKISEKTQNNSSAVQTDSSPQTRDIFAMDTYMNLKAYGENASQALAQIKRPFTNSRYTVRNNNTRQVAASGKCPIIDACYSFRDNYLLQFNPINIQMSI